jgi:hypothetical protein
MSSTRSDGSTRVAAATEGRALLDRLEGLLQRQLDLVLQGQLPAAEALSGPTEECVQEIVRARLPRVPGSNEAWPRVEQLYRQLSLALTAQRAEVSAALEVIQRTRKMLSAYGTGLSSP